MSFSNTAENDLLLLIFNNTNMANVGDATGLRGSTTVGSLYIALHTADPGEAGDQQTSEATFTGYSRVAVARSGAGWTVTGNAVTNAAAINIGPASSGPQVIQYVSVGVAASGASKIIFRAPLTPNPTANPSVTITIPAGDLDFSLD